MRQMNSHRVGLVGLVVLSAGWLAGCSDSSRLFGKTPPPQRRLSASAEDLRRIGLRQYWATQLALVGADRVRQVRLLGESLVVLTEKNFCYTVAASDGTQRCLARLSDDPAAEFHVPYFDGVRYLFAGFNRLVGVNALTGEPDVNIRLEMPSRTRAISDKEYVYTGSSDGQVFAYALESQVKHWNSKVGPAVTSLDFSHGRIIVARSNARSTVRGGRGELMAIRPRQWTEAWSKYTEAPISAPIAATDDAVFVACEDGSLYRFNAEHGWPEWQVRTPAALVDGPLLLNDSIVQYVPGVGTWLIHRGRGEILWKDPARLSYLGKSKDSVRFYYLDGSAVIVKDAKGQTLDRVSVTSGAVLPAPDPDGTKLFLLTASGHVMCLNDISLPYLVVEKR